MQFIYTALSSPLTKRILAGLIIALAITGLFYLVKGSGLNMYYKHNPDALMKEIPFYMVLKEHDPKLYTRIENDIKDALSDNQPAMALKTKVRSYLDNIISLRVPTAANDAVVAYMRVTLEEMKVLRSQGYGLCHRFLYPIDNMPLDLTKYVQKELVQADMEALTQVIRSSYVSPNPEPKSESVQLYLSHVYTKLMGDYGDNLRVLSRPLDYNVDKDQVCEMTIAMFEEILRLPVQQSGETLRYIVSQNNSQ